LISLNFVIILFPPSKQLREKMKKITLLYLLAFTSVASSAELILVGGIGALGINGKTCYHGTISNPYDEVYAMAAPGYSCPEYIHPTVIPNPNHEKKHTAGDPDCQTKIIPNNL
jgi:hypothetical protein